MTLWTVDRIMNRLNLMLDYAIAGKSIEDSFDETKMSALETKMAKYLIINQQKEVQLQKEKSRVDELISDISHQTKTPIANLLLYSELLEEMQDESNEEMVSAVQQQAEKLAFLIQSMMKTSRLESGVIQTVPLENSVQKLVDTVVAQARNKAQMKNIQIDVHTMNCNAIFDLKWTGEALYNILDNAIKYTNENGNIRICVSKYPLFIRIDIEDSGMGISESDLPKIFGRFYKCNATRQEEGVGLGLYLAREIVSRQGGYIKVSSELGKGSVFSVFLRNVI